MRRRLTWDSRCCGSPVAPPCSSCCGIQISSRLLPGTAQPLVLLDASLSMAGHGGRWREALDSARARGGVIWRFGDQVAAFDSGAPSDGASRLGPAIAAAAARGGPVTVVTDGGVSDIAAVAPDLLRTTAHRRVALSGLSRRLHSDGGRSAPNRSERIRCA